MYLRGWRFLYGPGLFILVVVGLGFLMTRVSEKLLREDHVRQPYDMLLEDIHLNEWDNGTLVTELRAKEAILDKEDLFLKEFEGFFFSLSGQVFSYKAHSGLYQFSLRNYMFYDVSLDFVLSDVPLYVIAKQLLWNFDLDRFEGRRGVSVKHGDLALKGENFACSVLEQKFHFFDQVLVDFYF